MVDWDDLRFVLAVARTGSALRAARALKVNQTTVSRRIAQIESAIGADLFESRQNGQILTPLGQIVATGAERIESEVLALECTITAQQRTLSGSVRFTSSEVLANGIIAPFLRNFRKLHPAVMIELIADDRRLDIGRSEADVALRAGARPEGGGIVAQRLPNSAWAAYCSQAYADEHGCPDGLGELDSHAIVGFEGALVQAPAALWLARLAPNAPVNTRSNSLTNHISAVKAGLGVGVLPCFVGDADADLLRCSAPIKEAEAELWLIVREDLKQALHVRAFVDCLSAHMWSLRGPLEAQPSSVKAAGAQA